MKLKKIEENTLISRNSLCVTFTSSRARWWIKKKNRDTATSTELTTGGNNEWSTSITDEDSTNSYKQHVDTCSNFIVTGTEDEDLDISSPKFIQVVSTSSLQCKLVVDVSHKGFWINKIILKVYEKTIEVETRESKPNQMGCWRNSSPKS